MVKLRVRGTSKTIILSILVVSLFLSVLVLYYFSESKANIESSAISGTNTSAEIEANNLASSLANKLEQITNNLFVLSESPGILEENSTASEQMMLAAQATTSSITTSYNFLSPSGELLASSNSSNGSKFVGNLSQRVFFTQAVKLWPVTYINTNYTTPFDDGQLVLFARAVYEPAPVGGGRTEDLRGVLVTTVNFGSLGALIKNEATAPMQAQVWVVDYNGTILYAGNDPGETGKSVYGAVFQEQIPDSIRNGYDKLLDASLAGEQVLQDYEINGSTTAVASQPIDFGAILGNASDARPFVTLYLSSVSTLAAAQVVQLSNIQSFAFLLMLGILGSAACSAIFIMNRNRTLEDLVKERTTMLEEANKKLVSYADAQKEFINVAAHEIRTPLQPIFTVMELMVDSANTSDGTGTITISKEEADMLQRGVKRLDDITRNLLDVTRIEAGGLALHKERFELNKMVEEDVQYLGSRMNGSTSREEIAFIPSERRLPVDVDRMRIFEVISNLVTNAVRASVDSEVVRVEISSAEVGKEAVVRVRDYGRGLTPKVAAMLFTKFGTHSESGLGLGLYISRKIVEAHGGRIWAGNNTDGRGGTSFYFSLPLAE